MDSKIDMLLQTGVLGSPVKRSTARTFVEPEVEADGSDEDSLDDEDEYEENRAPSPSRKGKLKEYSLDAVNGR